jgi:hypothetical protein
MYISVAYSRTHGFLKWCEARRPGNDAGKPSAAKPIAVIESSSDDCEAIEERPHRPGLVPGVGTSS